MGKFRGALTGLFISLAVGSAAGGVVGGSYYAEHTQDNYYQDIYPSISAEDSRRFGEHAAYFMGAVAFTLGFASTGMFFVGRALGRRQGAAPPSGTPTM